ncbi:hypothetical protein [Pelagibacterium montanilacus]|nr:hypothetical protein [Pelagibacterium montanilacus]
MPVRSVNVLFTLPGTVHSIVTGSVLMAKMQFGTVIEAAPNSFLCRTI